MGNLKLHREPKWRLTELGADGVKWVGRMVYVGRENGVHMPPPILYAKQSLFKLIYELEVYLV